MYEYNAQVDKVVDGDTIDCTIDLGFKTWKKIRVRMQGINTPESRTRDLEEKERGLAAKARLQEILKYPVDSTLDPSIVNIAKSSEFVLLDTLK